ncbi:sensor histidine kinase [Limisalsivibrio acetivorans]|uniref:sensor histidine kinase n=1 Tax=Limisalsivibrio acetivorans TaxID=1304888 RepID=UPI0003B353F8|nr:ATP-binding protein [Limisalsivibrio acetivorans]
MRTIRTESLNYQLFWRYIFFSIVAVLIISAVKVFLLYGTELNEVEKRFAIVEDSLVPPLERALWVRNDEMLSAQLLGITSMPDLEYAEISEMGYVISSGSVQSDEVIIRDYELRYNYEGSERIVGRLSVTAGLSGVYSRLWDSFYKSLIFDSAVILSVGLFMLLMFSRMVTSRLHAVSSSLSQLDFTSEIEGRLRVCEEYEKLDNELGELVGSINDLGRRLERELGLRHSTEKQLKLANEQMEEKVLERTDEIFKAQQKLVQLNEELNTLNSELEDRVADEVKTRREKEQLLIQQSRMASMGEMIGVIGHQWKQPLNSISLLAEMIEEEISDCGAEISEEVTRSAEIITNQVQFMAKTLDHFRNFFKPSSQKTVFSLIKATEDVLYIMAPIIEKEDVELVREFPEDDIFVYGYSNELKQVILNLLSNARDAVVSSRKFKSSSERGRLVLVIKPENGSVELFVQDNGGGIPDDIMPRIFEPYFTTKGEAGSGIGLFMSQVIITENMNGEIKAENMDKGSRFSIRLRMEKRDTTA